MPREKQKLDKPKKIVEVGAELVEGEVSTVVSEASPDTEVQSETSADALEHMPVSAHVPESVAKQLAPYSVLKTTIMRALPFVLISLILFAVPFFFSGISTFWLKYSQVRTYMLGALIWNLIGACLYAQVDKRSHKIMLIVIFALPLITSHHWASFMYMVEMVLRSVFNAPLP